MVLFDVFSNLKTVFINAGDHPFSLLSFLSLIRGTSIENVTVVTGYRTLSGLLSLDPRYIEIKGKYKDEQYEITEDGWDLIIKKC